MPNIKLKGQTGEVLTYEDVERVYFDDADKDGEVVYYTHGQAVNKTVTPNFASGDMNVPIADGELVTELTIEKPDTLLPENIRSGITVAGVTGDLIGDTEEVTVDLDMAEGGQVITPSAEGKVLSKVVVTKPGTMLPENIKAGVDIGGVVGEYVTPGTTKEIEPDFSEGDHTVTAEGDERWNKVVVKMPETLVPENIAKDVEIGGVVGTLEGGGSDIGTGAYNVKVIDYDGTVLAEKNLDEGEVFELPNAPFHEGLVFDGWSSPVTITDNTITVENQNITIGPMYYTASGATEIDIVLTKVTGLTFTFLSSRLNGMTSIDWGDGTTDSALTHTYSEYGKYIIKIYGMTAIANGTSSGGIVAVNNYTIIWIRFASGVTQLGQYAFRMCKSLEYITFPSSVTSIGTGAFYYCSSLRSITIPSRVTSVEKDMFYSCSDLRSITIPSGVTSIGNYAFSSCRFPTSITIPSGVTSIGDYAFNGCGGLRSITIPSGVTSIGTSVFYSCGGLRSITIPSGVTSIGTSAFASCTSVIKYDFTAAVSVPTLSSLTALSSMSSICQILVPSSLYSAWIAATNWSDRADYIVAV